MSVSARLGNLPETTPVSISRVTSYSGSFLTPSLVGVGLRDEPDYGLDGNYFALHAIMRRTMVTIKHTDCDSEEPADF